MRLFSLLKEEKEEKDDKYRVIFTNKSTKSYLYFCYSIQDMEEKKPIDVETHYSRYIGELEGEINLNSPSPYITVGHYFY